MKNVQHLLTLEKFKEKPHRNDTLIRMAIIKKTKNNKYCQGCEDKGTLAHCWWKCQPLLRFLKNLKI
jgi:hypothetical protein